MRVRLTYYLRRWVIAGHLVLGWGCVAVDVCHAVPASPAAVQVAQPDGSSFRAVAKGDERQGWIETHKGYTVIKNKETGFFEYAIEGARGLLPSGIIVTPEGDMKDVAPEMRPRKGIRPPPRNREVPAP